MRKLLLVLITIIFCGCIKVYGQPTLDTCSVLQGQSLSRAFYTHNVNVLAVTAPATLDATVLTLMVSNEIADNTFTDYTMDGSPLEIKLIAGKTTVFEPHKYFAIPRYLKLRQGTPINPTNAAAKRTYTIWLGRY